MEPTGHPFPSDPVPTVMHPDGAVLPPPRRGHGRQWLYILAAILLAVNVFFQRPATLSVGEIKDLETGKKVEPFESGPELALAKLGIALKGENFFGQDIGGLVLQQFDQYAAQSELAQDQFRAALLFGRLGYQGAMHDRFTTMEKTLDPESPLRQDIEIVRALIPRDPAAERVEPSGKPREDFLARHGWFAKVALDTGQPGGVYEQAEQDGSRLASVGAKYLGLQALMGLTGVGVLIVLAVMAFTRRIRPFPSNWRADDDPAEPGHASGAFVWLEAVTAFFAAFLLMKAIMFGARAAGVDIDILGWFPLVMPWIILPVILWANWRGVSWSVFRRRIGWHAGRGFFREIGAGIAAYLALIPVVMVVTIIVVAINAALGFKPPRVADRAFELGSGHGLQLLLTFALVTIWAPVLEEAVFRGSLYRFVRSRGGWLLAAGVTAFAFAIMHGYAAVQLIAVGTLGFGFALLREWRGSLISCMTGHFLQNAVVFTFISQFAPLMRG